MVNTSCAVFRCGSTSHKHKGVRFHQFPRDERCLMWIQACKREDLKGKDAEQLRHMHICSLHFEQRMYGKQLLKKSAVPTLNLPATLTSDSSTQTENYNYAPLQVCTSQGVQTDDEVFYVLSGTEAPAALPVTQEYYQSDQRNDFAKDPHRSQMNVVEDNSNFITMEQFLMGCDAFLPDGLNALIKSHITLSIEYNDSNLLS
ncbi:THAP domain-containing protein 11-like [Vanessa cardui]|uniref:THAP domain-containing protein 11-like n=1 Tax=Vanessa cardui TaxID=171605 RepID=UPI001F13C4FD|nr:THAP domain-containing protein 11-like [Vanessa cardui]